MGNVLAGLERAQALPPGRGNVDFSVIATPDSVDAALTLEARVRNALSLYGAGKAGWHREDPRWKYWGEAGIKWTW